MTALCGPAVKVGEAFLYRASVIVEKYIHEDLVRYLQKSLTSEAQIYRLVMTMQLPSVRSAVTAESAHPAAKGTCFGIQCKSRRTMWQTCQVGSEACGDHAPTISLFVDAG